MDIITAQQRLAYLWFALALLIGAIMAFETSMGAFKDASVPWDWLKPNLLPSLSLMIGVFVAEYAADNPPGTRKIAPFFFHLTFGLSALYLVAILAIILQPWSEAARIALMKSSQATWLSALQGFVTASLGVFFVKARNAQPAGHVSETQGAAVRG
jgi:hypothetical protein